MRQLYALVGMKWRGTEALVASLLQGEPLTLVREPENKHDRNAIQVWARSTHVAYIKASQARPLAAFIDQAWHAWQAPHRVSGDSMAPDANRLVERKAAYATLAIDGGKWPMAEVET